MGVDHDGVGGIGVLLDEKMIETLINGGVFTEDEWEEDPSGCMETIGVMYCHAGNAYSGDTYFYMLVDGDTLDEINKNAPSFIETLNGHGIKITGKDLAVISDISVW